LTCPSIIARKIRSSGASSGDLPATLLTLAKAAAGCNVGSLRGFQTSTSPVSRACVTRLDANAAMWTDPALKNTCLVDPVGVA